MKYELHPKERIPGWFTISGFFATFLLTGISLCSASGNNVGICSHLPANDNIRAIWAADFSYARIDLPWDEIEQTQGVRNWNRVNRVVSGFMYQDGFLFSVSVTGE